MAKNRLTAHTNHSNVKGRPYLKAMQGNLRLWQGAVSEDDSPLIKINRFLNLRYRFMDKYRLSQ